ncbi:MAG: hypothetical protein ACOC1X_04325, partial [Promethearchaeota archaeon]
SMEELEEAFDSADNDDEFEVVNDEDDEYEDLKGDSEVDLDDIEKELQKMDGMSEEFEVDDVDEQYNDKNDPYERLKKLQEEMNDIINNLDNKENYEEGNEDETIIQEFNEKMSGVYGERYADVLGADYDKLLDIYKKQRNSEPKHFNDDENVEISMDDDSVEESHGISLSNNKRAGANTQPRPDYANYKKNKLRKALQKEQQEKRIKSLISEKKNLKKKFNNLKNKSDEANNLLENYRDVIKKYRDRLNEMVIFNTNLSHVNNLLVNEELDLSAEDKKEIINKFKPVQSIDESERTYKNILKDKKDEKSKLIESLDKRYNNVTSKSSKDNLGETVEKTGYENKDHIDKIKKYMFYDGKK